MKLNLAAVALCFLLILSFPAVSSPAEGINWADRVLPLPQEMNVERSVQVRAGDTGYAIKAHEEAPVFKTARELLGSFALAGEGEGRGFNIELVLLEESPGAVPAGLAERLRNAPNADQAYAVTAKEGSPPGLTLAANTPVGLLYAAHTLAQLVKPGGDAGGNTMLEIPLAEILDWPDIAQRGEWSSNLYPAWGWYSQWKLNMFRVAANSWRRDFSLRHLEGERGEAFFEWAGELGYILVPYISHLGHLSRRGWSEISPAVYTERDPGGFCWTTDSEGIDEVMHDFIRRMAMAAEHPGEGIKDAEVWLTETSAEGCACEGCAGENRFILETKGIIRAYERVKEEFPGLRLRILLSQGSRPVNERIIEIADEYGVGVAYYDGHLTYITDREPMIFEELEEFAGRGGFADVMPQVTPDFYALYPGSIPQFIQFRAREFADKKLQAVTAYSQGGPFYYGVNMAAWAEYTWNSRGRPTEDFARAYATITGIGEPELFSEWITHSGEAAWELAVSGYMASLQRARFGRMPRIIGDDEFQKPNTIRMERAMSHAREAVRLARQSGNPLMLADSDFTFGALKSIKVRSEAGNLLRTQEGREVLPEKLNRLDISAHLARASLQKWHQMAMEKRDAIANAPGFLRPPDMWGRGDFETLPDRQSMAAHSLLRASDTEWQTAALFGLPDIRGERTPVEISEWTNEDFLGGNIRLRVDLTGMIPASGGQLNLGMNLLEGDDCRVSYVAVVKSGEDRSHETYVSFDEWNQTLTAGRPERSFSDRLVRVPPAADGEIYFLETVLGDTGGAGSTGFVSLRRVWPHEDFPEELIGVLMEK